MPSESFRAANWLADILDNINRSEGYILGLDSEALSQDGLRRDAVERCLERICEAAVRLGDHAAVLMPDQSWGAIRGLGNRLRHAYDRVDCRGLGRGNRSPAGTEGRRCGCPEAIAKAWAPIGVIDGLPS